MTTQHELNAQFKADRKASTFWQSAHRSAGVTSGHPVEEQEAPMTTNDTRTPRERAEEAAAEMYNGPISRQAFTAGFLARDAEPTTVSAEQIEKAAMAINAHHECLMPVWSELVKSKDRANQNRVRRDREYAELALHAAGFRIEGDTA